MSQGTFGRGGGVTRPGFRALWSLRAREGGRYESGLALGEILERRPVGSRQDWEGSVLGGGGWLVAVACVGGALVGEGFERLGSNADFGLEV